MTVLFKNAMIATMTEPAHYGLVENGASAVEGKRIVSIRAHAQDQ